MVKVPCALRVKCRISLAVKPHQQSGHTTHTIVPHTGQLNQQITKSYHRREAVISCQQEKMPLCQKYLTMQLREIRMQIHTCL